MSDVLLVLPLLIPLTTAALCLAAWRRTALHRILAVVGTAALLAAGVALLAVVRRDGICVTQAGAWPAPFGITLVADLFSAVMVALAGLVGMVVVLFSLATMDRGREAFGYYPLVHVVLLGVCGAFLTGDLFNLYVWFEVMLMASFVLLVLGGERPQLHGGIKYVTLNLVSSAVFLATVGILYGLTGTLNMADLARRLDGMTQTDTVTAVGMLFLVAFGIKAAVFPLFFWLPASYHTPPAAVGALLAGLLTKVGVYAMIRVFTLLFPDPNASVYTILLILSAITMVVGLIGALAQRDFRRVLSFNLVGHIGFTTVGLALWAPAALGGSILYALHHMLVISTLFLVSGLFLRQWRTTELSALGGLYRSQPAIACLALVPLFSLAGVPPLSGFIAKVAVIGPILGAGHYVLAAVALCVATTIIINSGRARYAWVTILPLAFVSTTTLVAGFKSITDIFWPLAQKPETSVQGLINTSLTAIIMIAAVVIMLDSIRRWVGTRKQPQVATATA